MAFLISFVVFLLLLYFFYLFSCLFCCLYFSFLFAFLFAWVTSNLQPFLTINVFRAPYFMCSSISGFEQVGRFKKNKQRHFFPASNLYFTILKYFSPKYEGNSISKLQIVI